MGGNADFNDEFGGAGVFVPIFFGGSAHYGDIGFRFRIDASDGLFGAQQESGGEELLQEV